MTRSACLLALLAAFAISCGCDSQTTTTTSSPATPVANPANEGSLVKGKGGMLIKKGPQGPKALGPIKLKSD